MVRVLGASVRIRLRSGIHAGPFKKRNESKGGPSGTKKFRLKKNAVAPRTFLGQERPSILLKRPGIFWGAERRNLKKRPQPSEEKKAISTFAEEGRCGCIAGSH